MCHSARFLLTLGQGTTVGSIMRTVHLSLDQALHNHSHHLVWVSLGPFATVLAALGTMYHLVLVKARADMPTKSQCNFLTIRKKLCSFFHRCLRFLAHQTELAHVKLDQLRNLSMKASGLNVGCKGTRGLCEQCRIINARNTWPQPCANTVRNVLYAMHPNDKHRSNRQTF